MTPLEKDVKSWADKRFGERDNAGRIRKLGEEYGELGEAVARFEKHPTDDNFAKMVEESADVGLVVSDLLALHGVSFEAAMRTKLEANKLRSSKYPDMRKTLEYIAEHVPNTPWGKAAAEALK